MALNPLIPFLDTIPTCTDIDWNTWDIQALTDANTETPGRITLAMEAQLRRLSLISVNIVNIGFQFNALCFRYDLFLNTGQNLTIYESLYRFRSMDFLRS